VARGDYSGEGIVFSKSDDFILPEIIAGIIADNAGRRPIFWGLGDPATKLTAYIVPYDIVLEVVTEQPPPEEMRRRTAASVNALLDVTSYVEREGPGELRDPFFKSIMAVYYSGLSGHLARRGIIGPQEELFKSYVRLVPDDFNGYQNLGAIYLLKGQPETAVEYYRKALALSPDNVNLKARLARALFAAGRGDEAAEIAESLEGADAGEAGYVAGIILREEGEVDKALAAFEAAREMYGGEAEFWWELGLTYEAAGDYRAAVEAFSRAVELNPASAVTYTARGVCYLRLGEAAAAAADFEAGLALYPADAKAHYNLACIRAGEGRTDEALVHLEAALALDAGRYVPMAAEDPDLESCRGLPAFAALLDKYGSAEPEAGP
jgi:tetratricopeptide (TPR) repeat protein